MDEVGVDYPNIPYPFVSVTCRKCIIYIPGFIWSYMSKQIFPNKGRFVIVWCRYSSHVMSSSEWMGNYYQESGIWMLCVWKTTECGVAIQTWARRKFLADCCRMDVLLRDSIWRLKDQRMVLIHEIQYERKYDPLVMLSTRVRLQITSLTALPPA